MTLVKSDSRMKVVSIVGARPQFIKLAPVLRALQPHHVSVVVHTGQHYDERMSSVFFDELGLPSPDYNLGVGSGRHGWQTGEMLLRLEPVLKDESPDWVVVYGDTNSTLAGALAAAKLRQPIAHVEAGLRSFNERMPEEINRKVVDHLSDRLLCPSEIAVGNLRAEGVTRGVECVGDVMVEAVRFGAAHAASKSTVLQTLAVARGEYVVATVHRAENTDAPQRLRGILDGLNALDERVIFPVHPRTARVLEQVPLTLSPNIRLIDPLPYLDMIQLQQNARAILTDSGGVQKEAYWLGVPCVTLRDETEWVETVDAGWNVLAGTDPAEIKRAAAAVPPAHRPCLYGDGQASARIVAVLEAGLARSAS